jgi:formate dehydrogenase maturation protein FdhE
MSRYGTRLRNLEGKLVPGACPICAGGPVVDFVTIHGDETLPPRQACSACGEQHKVFVVELADDPTDKSVTDISKAFVKRRRWYGSE